MSIANVQSNSTKASEEDVLIRLRNMAIRTDERFLVKNVNVDVFKKQVTALCGPSGSGKSLTARAIMGVLDVLPGLVEGEMYYPGLSGGQSQKDWFLPVKKGGEIAQKRLLKETMPLRGSYFTYSPQSASSALNPGRTIGSQLEMAISRRAKPPSSLSVEIRRILAEVGLRPSVSSSLPSELSGGMCQRAALAIAVAPQPKVVIADEPETGLDPVLRRGVIELLIRVTHQNGAGLLLISHHEDTVTRIADHVVRLNPED
ncbi:MAG: hypothetical protein CMK59_05995 [Proteobacteria bacterium]|nr:hypothetical protein [Pseudomonadota bacterium]